MFLSICIPSYNRPIELKRLLNTINTYYNDEVEIVICEDNSPRRMEIRKTVDEFKRNSKVSISYYENLENFGYDKNLRECIKYARGEYIVYMGDDDVFLDNAIDRLIDFLKSHDVGYVLRSYKIKHKNGISESFTYYSKDMFFDKGEDAVYALFRKSVFISGFTFKKAYIANMMTDKFDGTLLFQLYILAHICMNYQSAYFNYPITELIEGNSVPYFGSSKNENYTPGTITIENSISFIKKFFYISEYFDNYYNIHLTKFLKTDISKYSFPILAIQRNKGIELFIKYCKELEHIGINCTVYYYIYKYSLLVFGKEFCENIIIMLKKILGKTPEL